MEQHQKYITTETLYEAKQQDFMPDSLSGSCKDHILKLFLASQFRHGGILYLGADDFLLFGSGGKFSR